MCNAIRGPTQRGRIYWTVTSDGWLADFGRSEHRLVYRVTSPGNIFTSCLFPFASHGLTSVHGSRKINIIEINLKKNWYYFNKIFTPYIVKTPVLSRKTPRFNLIRICTRIRVSDFKLYTFQILGRMPLKTYLNWSNTFSVLIRGGGGVSNPQPKR